MTAISTQTSGDRAFVIATGNSGKRREFTRLLDDLLSPNWEIFDRNTFPDPLDEIEETGSTFLENAILKAVGTARQTGCCALSDDSGLEVDALGGEPGVHSARFAGEDASDDDNNRLLVERLADVPQEQRTARFVCVLCLVIWDNEIGRKILQRWQVDFGKVDEGDPHQFGRLVRNDGRITLCVRGTLEGRIALEAAGSGGFGYDPHFYVPSFKKQLAQVSLQQKNSISHRAAAVKKLLSFGS